jgi:hypothetical protein
LHSAKSDGENEAKNSRLAFSVGSVCYLLWFFKANNYLLDFFFFLTFSGNFLPLLAASYSSTTFLSILPLASKE